MKEAMTKSRLDSLRILKREITRTKERLDKLKSVQKITETHSEKITLVENALKGYLQDAEKEALELITYIENIQEPKIKEIFMLRYFDGVRSWQKIAFSTGEYDESYVRRLHNAYLKSHP